jgi:acyl-coenzyme A thioesterase PaaI-like protein
MVPPDTTRHTPISLQNNSTIDERASHCFGCGPANPQGLHLVFTTDTTHPDHPVATSHFQLDRNHEGPPGHIHGGIVATLLDEAMSKINRPLNVLAMTRHMEVDYLRPIPLYKPLVLVGRHLRRDGRKLFHEAEIRDPVGAVLARAKGLFIAVDEKLLAAAGLTQPES